LYLLDASRFVQQLARSLRKLSLARVAAWILHLTLALRVLRLLFAAWCKRVLGVIPLLDERGRDAIATLAQCDAVYCSGGGNLNDLWLRTELIPRAVTYRLAAILRKPCYVSGQGIGPLKSWLGLRLLAWGARHVDFFACRDREESVAQLIQMGVDPKKLAALGDDAFDLRPSTREQAGEILHAEGAPLEGRPLMAVHVRLTNFSLNFRGTGIPFTAAICDEIVERLGCHIVFVPITNSRERAHDRDIGDAFEVYAQMKQRKHVTFLCQRPYTPPEMKAVVARCIGLVGYSYHAWVFALTSGLPTFGLYYGEYFRMKSAGLFAWYDKADWIWDLERSHPAEVVAGISTALRPPGQHRESLEAKTRELTFAVEKPARMLAENLAA
jgi:polysaccharide pyruvyl transferase WcaK-like protein